MIPHNRPTAGAAEAAAAQRVIESGWLAQGPEVAAFELEMCAYLGLPEGHAVALSSGTAALFLALWAMDAKQRKIAIPVYSCAALRNAVLMAGGEPMPIDVEEGSPNIALHNAVSAGAAIAIAAHMFGTPLQWGETAIPIIEDCAQALGTRIDGRPVGISGTVGVFSFFATKMITCGGQGGMLVSRDRALVDAVRDYREFDCRRDQRARFNFQMTDLQAAVGRVQLSRLDEFLACRQEHHLHYAAAGLPLWQPKTALNATPNRFRALLETDEPMRISRGLLQRGVRAIIPVEDWELLDTAAAYPNARRLTHSLLSLPVFPSLSASDREYIIKSVTEEISLSR